MPGSGCSCRALQIQNHTVSRLEKKTSGIIECSLWPNTSMSILFLVTP